MHKTQIREHINPKKKLLTPQQIATYAQNFCKQLSGHSAFIESQHIAFYYSSNNELDVMPALLYAIKAGKKCYLPHIATNSDILKFIYFDNETSLTTGAYNIPSPRVTSSSVFIDPSALDLVIMPVVAIDKDQNRIGMGKGYYDKTFSFKNTSANKPKLIAACYKFQLIAEIEPEPWDIQCDDSIIV
jgi:5-formyltetrahydrofolate cyclo-ligase